MNGKKRIQKKMKNHKCSSDIEMPSLKNAIFHVLLYAVE